MVYSYLSHGCDVIQIFKLCVDKRGVLKPNSFVQFENENDVTPSVIDINILYHAFLSSKYFRI